jgi:U3 small nucleolar RNA-associated protein 19
MAKDPITRIQLLEKHLTKKTDSFNPNPLLELVALSRHEKPEVVHSAIWALHRVFIKLVGDGRLGRAIFKESDGEDEEIDLDGEGGAVRDWMRKRLREYVDVLGGLLRDSEEALRVGHSGTCPRRY